MGERSDRRDQGYRVHNRSTHTLLLTVFKGTTRRYYRLLPGCASPHDAQPVRLQAASEVPIDGAPVWEIEPSFDVHVTESDPDSPRSRLHISGLGVKQSSELWQTPSSSELWAADKDDIWITVLGAGITGLTAAHELITRGFHVQVIEKAHDSPVEAAGEFVGNAGIDRFRRGLSQPDVGGMARTQWTTLPLRRGEAPPRSQLSGGKIAAMRSVHGDCHWFGADKIHGQEHGEYRVFGVPWQKGDGRGILDGGTATELVAWLHRLSTTWRRSVAAVQLVVVVYGDAKTRHVRDGYDRLTEFLAYLASPAATALRKVLDRLDVFPTSRIDVHEEPRSERYVGLVVRVHEDLGLIAGEHGFRFFPGFYRHLRDTMRRTPIYDPQTRTFTARSAHDNLTEVQWQIFADPARKHPTALLRKPFNTMGGLVEQYRTMRRDLGYRPVDLLRFLLRLLRYMTSSVERRKKYYEDISWWDFLSLRRLDVPSSQAKRFTFGKRFDEALRHAPKALVAMSSEFADARTQGNIAVQLFMDQFELHDQSDSTLSGPTTPAWLSHWRTYLQRQGVRFFLGEVTKIKRTRAPRRAEQAGQRPAGETPAGAAAGEYRTYVDIEFPLNTPPSDYVDAETLLRKEGIRAHYYVSAMDIVGLARTTREFRAPGQDADHGVLTDLARLVGEPGYERDLEDITRIGCDGDDHKLDDRFQTLTGIQLYYRSHVSFENGHIYFAGSPWGLSAISQLQYWDPLAGSRRSGVVGNLSIDIGSWHGTTGLSMSNPNELSRDEIAHKVQQQICHCLGERKRSIDDTADYYHLDDFIGFAPRGGKLVPARNHAPFLINVIRDWKNRPRGEPWAPNIVSTRNRAPGYGRVSPGIWYPHQDGYPIHFENLVIAGTHMRTFTRMVTMEAANESARHAVNAILDHLSFCDRQWGPPARAATRDPASPRAARSEPEPAEPLTDTPLDLDQLISGPQALRAPERAELPADAGPDTHLPLTAGPDALREPPRSSMNVQWMATQYGDYCQIWDPETREFPDLEFLRLIDKHLLEAGEKRTDDLPAGEQPLAPHLFDILRIDELPDCLDGDPDAIRGLELLGGVLSAFQETSRDDLSSVFAVVEKARKKLTALLERRR